MAPEGSIRLPSQRGSAVRRILNNARRHRFVVLLTSRIRLTGLPLRIRPAFVILTVVAIFVLSALGFHPTLAQRIAPPVPWSDKLLHLVCFFLASASFYSIWSVDESARQWFWVYFAEITSFVSCILCGSIGSEMVQSLLPYKTFQIGDVVANLIGSTGGIALARYLIRAQRRAEELRRLYQPLDELEDDDELDEEDAALEGAERGNSDRRRRKRDSTWDASEGEQAIFGLGDEDDDLNEGEMSRWR